MNRDKIVLVAVIAIIAAVGIPAYLFSQSDDEFELDDVRGLDEESGTDENRSGASRMTTRNDEPGASESDEEDEAETEEAAVADPEPEALEPADYHAHIFGTIATRSKTPVPGAWVALCRDIADAVGQSVQGAPLMVVQTDERGQYLIENAPASESLMVRVEHEEHASKFVPNIRLENGERRRVDLIVHDGLTIRGRVRTTSGDPVAGAEILVEDRAMRFESTANANERIARTDDEGRFTVAHLTPGYKRVAARKAPFATAMQPSLHLNEKTALAEIELTMDSGSYIAGHVVDQTGAAVPGAAVSARALQAAGSRTAAIAYPAVIADAEGKFRYDGLAAGNYRLVVYRDGYSVRGAQAHAETGRDDVVLKLVRHPHLAGRVIDDATGASIDRFSIIAGAQETLSFRSERLTQRFESADGTFTFHAPRATGTIFLFAEAPGYAGGRSAAVSLNAGDAEGLEIRLHRGVSVRGTVRGAGKAVPGATVRLLPEDPRMAQQASFIRALHGAMRKPGYTTRSGPDGRWICENVRPGTYRVEVFATGHSRILLEDLVHVDKGDVSFGSVHLPVGATVTGTVLGPEGEPMARGNVKLSAHDGVAGPSSYNGTTDAQGRYTIRNVTPGSYWASVVGMGDSNLAAIFGNRNTEQQLVTVTDGDEVTLNFP